MSGAAIPFAPGLVLPADAATQTFAVIAKRGQGKTYTATYLAEAMLARGHQIVAIDPVGVWWGLRLADNGKAKGFDIPVFGDVSTGNSDLPLTAESGRLIARVIVERGISAVLDVSVLRKADRVRFLADFGEELVHRKKTSRTPLHVFLEEAQTVVPQKSYPGQERMVGAFHDLIQVGRNFGLGATLISQRPQLIDKDVLNQTECLIVGQLAGPQERKAIEGWIVEQGLDRKALVDALPSLARNDKWIWSPQWLGKTVRVTIPKKSTYDASRTPVAGAARATLKPLSKSDMEQLRVSIADTVKQVEANDPKVLHRRIAELERELKAKGVTVALAPAKVEVKTVEKPILRDGELASIERMLERIDKHGVFLAQVSARLNELRDFAQRSVDSIPPVIAGPLSRPVARATPVTSTTSHARDTAVGSARDTVHFRENSGSITNPQQKILNALAWYESIGRAAADKTQLAFMADTRHTSGGYKNNLGALRSAGLIDYPSPGEVCLTDAGRAVADVFGAPTTDEQLQERIASKLSNPQRAIVEALLALHPKVVDKIRLAEIIEVPHTSGGYKNNLGFLRTLGVITYPSPGTVAASAALFLRGSGS